MEPLTDLIDDILERLHDDETLFTRAEIIRWISDAYRKFSYQARHAKTFTCLDMPPRHTRAITFNWERNIGTGTWRKWTYTNRNDHTECTHLWEVQQANGLTPGASTANVSNLWELAYAGATIDTHYRFMLPKRDSGINKVWHDHDLIGPTTARILDWTETEWWQFGGEPYAWTRSLSDDHSFDLYEIETEYFQSFEIGANDIGNPRSWMEDDHSFNVQSRTTAWDYAYSWNGEPEAATGGALNGLGRRFTFGPTEDGYYYTHDWEGDEHPDQNEAATTNHWELFKYLEVGAFRSASSSDRQYFPSYQWATRGLLRQAGKSENALLIYHDVYPKDLVDEAMETPMVPDQIRKYLAYHALGILFNRQGEGYDPAMAGHYELRGARGMTILRRLGRIERLDESYVRGGERRGSREPPLPQLPSNYPRAPWLR